MIGTERGRRTWADDEGREALSVSLEDRKLPHEWTAHVAAETTARVRVRLLREGLYTPGCEPLHVDTYGIITAQGSPMPSPGGTGPGEWRQKELMSEIDIRGPQLYRYLCSGCKNGDHAAYHYNAAGIPADEAPAFFERKGPLVIPIEYRRGFDEPGGLAAVANHARQIQVSRQ